MRTMRFERMTEYSIQDPASLQAELDTILERGYGLAVQEEHYQVIGMAAPIRDIQGNVNACLSLWSLIDKISVDEVKGFAPDLIATTERISRQSGFEPG